MDLFNNVSARSHRRRPETQEYYLWLNGYFGETTHTYMRLVRSKCGHVLLRRTIVWQASRPQTQAPDTCAIEMGPCVSWGGGVVAEA